jgi:hypothetical protein
MRLMEYCDLQSCCLMRCHRVGPCPVSSTRPVVLLLPEPDQNRLFRLRRVILEIHTWQQWTSRRGFSVCKLQGAARLRLSIQYTHTVTHISYYASPWPIGQLLYFPWNVTYYSGNHSKAGLFSFTEYRRSQTIQSFVNLDTRRIVSLAIFSQVYYPMLLLTKFKVIFVDYVLVLN